MKNKTFAAARASEKRFDAARLMELHRDVKATKISKAGMYDMKGRGIQM